MTWHESSMDKYYNKIKANRHSVKKQVITDSWRIDKVIGVEKVKFNV